MLNSKDAVLVFAFYGSKDKKAEERLRHYLSRFSHLTDQMKFLSLSEKGEEEDLREKLLTRGKKQILFSALLLEEGATYSKLQGIQKEWQHSFEIVEITRPLLADKNDYLFLLQQFEKSSNPLLVFHGRHGLTSPAALFLHREGGDNMQACTLEGEPGVEALPEAKGKPIQVHPILLVGGHHLQKGILGEEKDSLFSRLKAKGYLPTLSEKALLDEEYLEELILRKLEEKLQ